MEEKVEMFGKSTFPKVSAGAGGVKVDKGMVYVEDTVS